MDNNNEQLIKKKRKKEKSTSMKVLLAIIATIISMIIVTIELSIVLFIANLIYNTINGGIHEEKNGSYIIKNISEFKSKEDYSDIKGYEDDSESESVFAGLFDENETPDIVVGKDIPEGYYKFQSEGGEAVVNTFLVGSEDNLQIPKKESEAIYNYILYTGTGYNIEDKETTSVFYLPKNLGINFDGSDEKTNLRISPVKEEIAEFNPSVKNGEYEDKYEGLYKYNKKNIKLSLKLGRKDLTIINEMPSPLGVYTYDKNKYIEYYIYEDTITKYEYTYDSKNHKFSNNKTKQKINDIIDEKTRTITLDLLGNAYIDV